MSSNLNPDVTLLDVPPLFAGAGFRPATEITRRSMELLLAHRGHPQAPPWAREVVVRRAEEKRIVAAVAAAVAAQRAKR